MREPERYQRWVKRDLGELVEELDLQEVQRHALRSRFVDRVSWTERQATRSRRAFYARASSRSAEACSSRHSSR